MPGALTGHVDCAISAGAAADDVEEDHHENMKTNHNASRFTYHSVFASDNDDHHLKTNTAALLRIDECTC